MPWFTNDPDSKNLNEWARPDLNRSQELPKLQGYQATPRAQRSWIPFRYIIVAVYPFLLLI